ncbi:MAG: heme-copper oxidase subunit III [Spirosomataceae bacterium]
MDIDDDSNSVFKRREPFTFMMYLAIFGSSLLFLFILFVFLKKEFDNQNIRVPLLPIFWISTLFILASSASISWANRVFKNQKFSLYRISISLTLLLGFLFLAAQLLGWQQLFDANITMANDTGGSFIYILSGLHIIHTAGGVIALIVAVVDAWRNRKYVDSFVYSVNPPNQLRLKLISIYWHFVDVLWLILFLFLAYHAV